VRDFKFSLNCHQVISNINYSARVDFKNILIIFYAATELVRHSIKVNDDSEAMRELLSEVVFF